MTSHSTSSEKVCDSGWRVDSSLCRFLNCWLTVKVGKKNKPLACQGVWSLEVHCFVWSLESALLGRRRSKVHRSKQPRENKGSRRLLPPHHPLSLARPKDPGGGEGVTSAGSQFLLPQQGWHWPVPAGLTAPPRPSGGLLDSDAGPKAMVCLLHHCPGEPRVTPSPQVRLCHNGAPSPCRCRCSWVHRACVGPGPRGPVICTRPSTCSAPPPLGIWRVRGDSGALCGHCGVLTRSVRTSHSPWLPAPEGTYYCTMPSSPPKGTSVEW